MKSCQDRIEDISADLDNELTADEKTELEAHLKECAECRALRDELTAMHQAFPLTDAKPPDTLTPGILYKTTVETTESPWRRRIAALISIAACVAVLLWIGQNNNVLSPVGTDTVYAGEEAAPGADGGGAGDTAPEADVGDDATFDNGFSIDDSFQNGPKSDENQDFADSATPYDALDEPDSIPVTEPAYLARYADTNNTAHSVRYVVVMEEPGVLCEAHAFELSEELSDGAYLIPLEVFEGWIGEGRVQTENEPIVIDPLSTEVLVTAEQS